MDEFKSDVPGVVWDASRNRWRAYLAGPKRKRMFLGTRKTKEEAEKLRLDANAGRFPSAEEKHGALLDKMARIRMRSVWREVTKVNHTWDSFDQFVATVGDRNGNVMIAAQDVTVPVGPTNFQWVPSPWHPANRGARNATVRAHRAANLDHYRDKELRRNFGITLADYNVLLEEQAGVCAICEQPETAIRQGRVLPLSVDHNHKTGAPRGLLCTACNIGIGSLAESEERLDAAKVYLQKWKAREAVVLPENVVPLKRKDP